MDPESVAFRPESFQTQDEVWRLHSDMLRVQQNQVDLADRLSRLERKHDDDSRLKNVWGTSSPFPSVLGGTPQQPPTEHFSNFDDNSSNLIGNLQLDAEEEPRRVGATSRANSVRFDETANQAHWAQASRSSLELISRTGSGMGGHVMSERSYSHKSDGRQSSTGHSVHSMTSGRANSLTGFGPGPATPLEPPGVAPGLFILGPVPAVIRCWLTTTFRNDTLLYAAICSGSYTSCMDTDLVKKLGYQERVVTTDTGISKVKLPVHLPEAVPVASSRSSSPAPQVPYLDVDFTVVERNAGADPKAIQIIIGSDTLREHAADILFSSNQLTLYDEDGSKLQVPFVRPEDDHAFKSLSVSSCTPVVSASGTTQQTSAQAIDEHLSLSNKHESRRYADSSESSPALDALDTQERRNVHETLPSTTTPAIWSNWRRDPSEKPVQNTLDWAKLGKGAPAPSDNQRRDIKVLKPTKVTRTTSMSSSVTGQSRFFDDGKQRGESEAQVEGRRVVSGEKAKPTVSAPGSAPVSGPGSGSVKARPGNSNPVGGASAFAWLKSESK